VVGGAIVTVLLCLALVTGCGQQPAAYSEEEVLDAFASVGVQLEVVMRDSFADPLDVSLGPTADSCDDPDAFRVNVFHSDEDLRAYLEREGHDATAEWMRSSGAEGRAFGNVLVGMNGETPCLTRAQVESAIAALP
jgi:hypothetical protein